VYCDWPPPELSTSTQAGAAGAFAARDASRAAAGAGQRAAARVNGSTRLTPAVATTTGAGTCFIVIAGDGPVCACGFDSIAHPDERRPQWMHRRKIVPG